MLLDLGSFNDALDAIDAARQARPNMRARAQRLRQSRGASIGRKATSISRSDHLDVRFARLADFHRSARRAARVLEDKGQFAEAVVELRAAIDQLSESEPVIYQMLGAAYEKLEKPKEAVAAYEKYLQLAPNGSYAAGIRSILDQLKREAAAETIILNHRRHKRHKKAMSTPSISKSRHVSHKASLFTESVIREMTREAMKYGAVNLSQGFPDFPAPQEIKRKAMEAIDRDVNQYAITWGSKDFRDALTRKTKWYLGLDIDPETEITVTCGSTEGMISA